MKFSARFSLVFARESGCLADFGDCQYKSKLSAAMNIGDIYIALYWKQVQEVRQINGKKEESDKIA
jgi:hypothetical protein